MKKISIMMNLFAARKEDAEKNEKGLTLIELVVAIGIMLILTVGGLIGYSSITDNARKAAVNSAATEVATGILVAVSDDTGANDLNEAKAVATKYNNSYPDITIGTPTQGGTASTGYSYTFSVTHTKGAKPSVSRTVYP